MYESDKRTVITLDAGGTNFVFGAIRGGEFVIDPITIPSESHSLDLCLGALEKGFRMVMERLPEPAAAISFAFPGPADYPNGIIGGQLPNFPSFRGGVALGPFLEDKLGIPVFINNDGDLYALGEALAGVLPEVNAKLEKAGSPKRYKNLIGYTLGTGFGCGIVANLRLHLGDNSCSGETWCLRNKKYPEIIVEESVSIRAIKRVYGERSGNKDHGLEPKEIFEIAEGTRPGDRAAAIGSFEELGEMAGEAMASASTLIDGLIAVGGGLAGAAKYIIPAIVKEMNSTIGSLNGDVFQRLPLKVYNLDDEAQFAEFAGGELREIKVYGSDRTVMFDAVKRIGIAVSKIGAPKAISLGAYFFALNMLDEK